jgi:hypothetical protein
MLKKHKFKFIKEFIKLRLTKARVFNSINTAYTAKIKAYCMYTVQRVINTYSTVKIQYIQRILQYYSYILSRDII